MQLAFISQLFAAALAPHMFALAPLGYALHDFLHYFLLTSVLQVLCNRMGHVLYTLQPSNQRTLRLHAGLPRIPKANAVSRFHGFPSPFSFNACFQAYQPA